MAGYPQTDTAGGHLRNALQVLAGMRADLAQVRRELVGGFPELTDVARAVDTIDARITAALIAIGEPLP